MKLLVKRDVLVVGAPVEISKRPENGLLTGIVVRGGSHLIGERVLFEDKSAEVEKEFVNCVWVEEKELLAVIE
jgi:hypothetical protein